MNFRTWGKCVRVACFPCSEYTTGDLACQQLFQIIFEGNYCTKLTPHLAGRGGFLRLALRLNHR